MKTVGNPQAQAPEESVNPKAQAPEESVNPQATKKTFVGEAGKTEVVFTEGQKLALQIKILTFIVNGKEPADVLKDLVNQPEYALFPYSDFLKLVQTVATTIMKSPSPDLSTDQKALISEKTNILLNLVEKKIDNENTAPTIDGGGYASKVLGSRSVNNVNNIITEEKSKSNRGVEPNTNENPGRSR